MLPDQVVKSRSNVVHQNRMSLCLQCRHLRVIAHRLSTDYRKIQDRVLRSLCDLTPFNRQPLASFDQKFVFVNSSHRKTFHEIVHPTFTRQLFTFFIRDSRVTFSSSLKCIDCANLEISPELVSISLHWLQNTYV